MLKVEENIEMDKREHAKPSIKIQNNCENWLSYIPSDTQSHLLVSLLSSDTG